jgi:ribosomal-protein-alanine N-acetyltransferase
MDARCRIRAASTADLDAIARIEASSFADPWPRRAFQAHLRDLFLVAESSSRVVGYLVARPMGDEAEILNVAVHPNARGAGLGHGLLQSALRVLQDLDVAAVFLEVRVSNVAARRLYDASGFTEVGKRRNYYADPVEDALILRRDFRPLPSPQLHPPRDGAT